MKPLIIRRLARADVRSARNWYERERRGLGSEFTEQLDNVMARVRELPLQFPDVRSGVRRALVQRFPYAIYFVMGPDGVPAVIAVLHQHQDPSELEKRAGLEMRVQPGRREPNSE